MKTVRLKPSWPGPFQRGVRDADGKLLETLTFQPGQQVDLTAEQFAAVEKDVRKGAIELCSTDDKGRAHADRPILRYARTLAESVINGLLARGRKEEADALQTNPERAAEILLDGVLSPPEGVVRSLAEVSAAFGLRSHELKAWRKAGMPGKSGAYDLAEIHAWAESLPPEEPEGAPEQSDQTEETDTPVN